MIELSSLLAVPRNQSAEHAELASRCLRWFAARSTGRGIVGATEVSIAPGYVLDAMAIGGFQHRHLTKYLSRSGLHEKTIRCTTGEPETVGDTYNEFACAFEVKVSRADFRSTFGDSPKHSNRKAPIASMHWCATPKGMVVSDELPEFWGLLEASGCGLRETRPPQVFVVGSATIHKCAYDIQMRGRRGSANWLHIPTCPCCLTEYGE